MIGVSRPGEIAPAKIWHVQTRSTPDRPSAFHYPCAIEHQGRLFVVYTAGFAGRRQCELAIIPVTSLRAPRPENESRENTVIRDWPGVHRLSAGPAGS